MHDQRKHRNSPLGWFDVVSDVVVRMASCVISVSAESASVNLQMKASLLALKSHLGNSMITDPISDMIIRIKNGSKAGLESVVLPYSKLKESIAVTLEKEGYLKSVAKKGKKVSKQLEVALAYDNGTPVIHGLERVSKLSKRVYIGAKDMQPFRSGFGSVILSTPKGILTETSARKENVGGEVLFKIW